jgi:glycosyltransferase involved in cell wall biosynthesis
MKLIVQIPCLNEEASLPDTLRAIPRVIPGIGSVEVLVIDDGSSDGTSRAARAGGADHIVRFTRRKGLAAGFLYYDARVDDARLTLTVVKTAASLSAVAVNRVEATGLLRAGSQVSGAVLADRLTGRRIEARAGVVINAGVRDPLGRSDLRRHHRHRLRRPAGGPPVHGRRHRLPPRRAELLGHQANRPSGGAGHLGRPAAPGGWRGPGG